MQFLFLRTIKVHLVLLLTSMVLFTAGCEDDDHDDHQEEGHTDADGFVLKDESGTQVYREFEGAFTGAAGPGRAGDTGRRARGGPVHGGRAAGRGVPVRRGERPVRAGGVLT